MRFVLMTEFIGLFDTARDYTLQFIIKHTHIYQCPQSHLHCRCSVAATTANISLSLDSRIVSGLRYQLLTAAAEL
jgi:hypothetical protein